MYCEIYMRKEIDENNVFNKNNCVYLLTWLHEIHDYDDYDYMLL